MTRGHVCKIGLADRTYRLDRHMPDGITFKQMK
jgi:hypothetical protein